jgi:hypothetical protein
MIHNDSEQAHLSPRGNRMRRKRLPSRTETRVKFLRGSGASCGKTESAGDVVNGRDVAPGLRLAGVGGKMGCIALASFTHTHAAPLTGMGRFAPEVTAPWLPDAGTGASLPAGD